MRNKPVESARYEHDIAITAVGRSPFGSPSERSWTSLAVEACRHALCDARLSPTDIDGICVHGGSVGLPGLSDGGVRALERTLGLHPIWHTGSTESPGGLGSIVPAMLALSAGLCSHVLCLEVRGDASASASRSPETVHSWMARYLSAEICRAPFKRLDLLTPGSGATALVISGAHLIRPEHRPIWVDAVGTRQAPADATGEPATRYQHSHRAASEHLWCRASVTPRDVDLALIEDRCTSDVLEKLDGLQLCTREQAAELVRAASRVSPGGDLPLNPDDGRSAAATGGYGQLHEAVVQLRGEAGARQVPNARVAVVSSTDPTGSAMAMVLGTERF